MEEPVYTASEEDKSFETIKNDSFWGEITYRRNALMTSCPANDRPDTAALEIVYVPSEFLINNDSIESWLTRLAGAKIYQEDLTAKVFDEVLRRIRPRRLEVRTIYRHKMAEVVCRLTM